MTGFVLVDGKTQTADGTVAHDLVFPCTVVFFELVFKDLYRIVVYVHEDAVRAVNSYSTDLGLPSLEPFVGSPN